MIPVFCCFYTIDTIYEQEAARLRQSLDVLGLRHDMRPVDSLGSWALNAGMTADFIHLMLDEHDGPIVYINADAVVWSMPYLLAALDPVDHDIAVHYRRGVEMLNGTIWLGNTRKCRDTIDDYRLRIGKKPGDRNEQRHLADAIREIRPRVFKLPPEYCWIHDIMADDLAGVDPVIEHLQCSREFTGSEFLPNRRVRLKRIGG